MRRYAVYETEALVHALQSDGYACISEAITVAQCEAARHKIDGLEPQHWDEARGRGDRDLALDRYLNVFNRDPYWLQFFDRPGVIDLAEAALGHDCHVIAETAWRSHPGFVGEPLHVDYAPMRWPEAALGNEVLVPVFILTVHFYLNRVTADLAPTRVVPGSHRAGRAPGAGETGWNGRSSEAILACPGDALVFRSDVWHSGSDNTGDSIRYLLQVHYGRREMAQHFSPYLEWRFEPRVIAAATPRQRRLLGEHAPGAYD